MHFTTIQFAVFFLFALTFNWILRRRGTGFKVFLLVVNYFFYGCLDVRFLFILAAVSLANWSFAFLIAQTRNPRAKKAYLITDVAINLGILAFFKYLEFFHNILGSALTFFYLQNNLPLAEIIFPIGISFFTFQGLSYAIDVYRDPGQLAPNPLDIFLFVSFFPTIMSGPIMRAGNFIPQLTNPQYDSRSFQVGFALILSGLFKKIVIASYLSEHIVRGVFQVPADYSSLTVLIAVYSYSIQIFCDFSGYSDLAIGLALLLGFRLPDNFRDPYRSTNLQEFWRNWHISLSTWLRDYLYIPLGGNRKGRARKYINLMITMVLGGLWHGAHFRFIVWGALHGLGVTLTHIYDDIRKRRVPESGPSPAGPIKKAIFWFLTFNFVSFLWVFFRAEDTNRAWEVFQAIFSFNRLGAGFELLIIPAVLIGLGVQFFGHYGHDLFIKVQERLPVPLQAALIGVLGVLIIKLGPDGVLPFIYFQF